MLLADYILIALQILRLCAPLFIPTIIGLIGLRIARRYVREFYDELIQSSYWGEIVQKDFVRKHLRFNSKTRTYDLAKSQVLAPCSMSSKQRKMFGKMPELEVLRKRVCRQIAWIGFSTMLISFISFIFLINLLV